MIWRSIDPKLLGELLVESARAVADRRRADVIHRPAAVGTSAATPAHAQPCRSRKPERQDV
ncbi:MAG: hypothetical protein EA405_00955 [Rhodospirillales bacterium]|nr:MAG: hypothetical protein EA405_00955 [Rhodospirillales bacterium]